MEKWELPWEFLSVGPGARMLCGCVGFQQLLPRHPPVQPRYGILWNKTMEFWDGLGWKKLIYPMGRDRALPSLALDTSRDKKFPDFLHFNTKIQQLGSENKLIYFCCFLVIPSPFGPVGSFLFPGINIGNKTSFVWEKGKQELFVTPKKGEFLLVFPSESWELAENWEFLL